MIMPMTRKRDRASRMTGRETPKRSASSLSDGNRRPSANSPRSIRVAIRSASWSARRVAGTTAPQSGPDCGVDSFQPTCLTDLGVIRYLNKSLGSAVFSQMRTRGRYDIAYACQNQIDKFTEFLTLYPVGPGALAVPRVPGRPRHA